MSETRAIIDIGSNTVRMVIYSGPARAPQPIFNEKVTAKLGKGVAVTGRLSDKGSAAALASLARYAAILRLKGVADIQVVATAAIRDAANGGEFLDQVRALGLQPRLLSGEEEAIASATGVMAAFPGASGVVADLGGGSLELVDIDRSRCSHGVSLPFGTLRLPDLRAMGPAKFKQHIANALTSADWSARGAEPLYLVGGSNRAFARYAMEKLDWPLDDPHGFELDAQTALKLCSGLLLSHTQLQLRGVSSFRAAALPDAAALLAELVRTLQPAKLVFSSWGLREGLLYQRLTAETQAQDPVLAGVSAFAQAMGASASCAAMVAGWTTAALPEYAAGHEPLRLAATMFALAAANLEPNLRVEESLDWALRKRWIGIDAEARALLGAALHANAGQLGIPSELDRLASKASLQQAIACGFGIRLCRRFSALAAPVLSHSSLAVDGGKLSLSVDPAYRALCTDLVEKDLRQLAELLGLSHSLAVRG